MSMRAYLQRHTNPPVFVIAGVLMLAFVLWGIFYPSGISSVAERVNDAITTYAGWLYILAATGFVVFVLIMLVSRWGTIRLGPPDSRPEYSVLAWFAMLFTAGMGIGLVFYAVSEPVADYLEPPTGDGSTPEASRNAMVYMFYHWGLHPWAIYIVLGMALGYFAFRRGLPLRPAAALYPLIGNRIYGWIGNTVDVLAVFGTLFGLATSLGIGGQQVGAGLAKIFGIDNTPTLQIVLILAITSVAVVSVMLGIDKGIRNLSLINLWLALALMVFVFAFGPTRNLLDTLVFNVGAYLQDLPGLSFQTNPGNPEAQSWQQDWTLFYWGWWMSWSPFVGMFIARISYGRTLRQFITGAMFAPVGASMVWLTVFGNTALKMLSKDNHGPLSEASDETALFVLLEHLPIASVLATVASVVGILVVVLFFATSSDSGSLVVDILTNGGDPHPMWQQRLFWAVLEGVIAAVLVAAGAASGADALGAIQTASIVAGLPLCLVLIAIAIGLVTGLRSERLTRTVVSPPNPLTALRTSAQRITIPPAEPTADTSDEQPTNDSDGADGHS